MEAGAPILAHFNLKECRISVSSCPTTTPAFHPSSHSKSSYYYHVNTSLCFKTSSRPTPPLKSQPLAHLRPVKASSAQAPASSSGERWLLEPVGDGDWRHIGFKVPKPGAYEIVSESVIVGRTAEKANLVIPVATVSALHARLEMKGGALLVTDLDSTNGTFINEKRLTPGVVATILPGNLITFGDTHLAIFRVSKLEKEDLPSKQDVQELEVVTVEANADSIG